MFYVMEVHFIVLYQSGTVKIWSLILEEGLQRVLREKKNKYTWRKVTNSFIKTYKFTLVYFENRTVRNFAYYCSIYEIEENVMGWECNILVRTINIENTYE